MRRQPLVATLVAIAALGAAVLAPSAHAAPDGKAIYQARCASCHQANGQGVPNVFPPLAGAEIVNGPAKEHITIVLKGRTGPITVKGKTYNGAMPAHAGLMSDAEIAAVISYERTNFGNKGGAVTPAQVKALR